MGLFVNIFSLCRVRTAVQPRKEVLSERQGEEKLVSGKVSDKPAIENGSLVQRSSGLQNRRK